MILNKSLPLDEEDLLNYSKSCNLPINNKHRFSMIPNVRNMIDPAQYCKLVTRKCNTESYYIHAYNPNFWMNNRTEDEIGEISKLIQSNENFFDLEYRENNCNCITIVLNVRAVKIDIF